MFENSVKVDSMNKEQAAKWLGELGLFVSGKKEQLIQRVKLYNRCPKLVDKLKKKVSRNFTFPCSLDPLSIPPITAKWEARDELLPKVCEEIFIRNAAQKKRDGIFSVGGVWFELTGK